MASMRRNRRIRRERNSPGCFSVVLFTVLLTAALVAVATIFFKIENIEVEGNVRYRTDEVRTASGIEWGDNLIFFNKFSAINDIFDELPYVDRVKMRRSYPSTLVITVTETYAAAYIPDGEDHFWLMSPTCKLLEHTREKPDGAIEIQGLVLYAPEEGRQAAADGEDSSKVESLLALMNALDEEGMLGTVSMISVEGVYDLQMVFLDRFTVELGMPEQLNYKLEFLMEIEDRLAGDDRGVIDLSKLLETGEARFKPYSY